MSFLFFLRDTYYKKRKESKKHGNISQCFILKKKDSPKNDKIGEKN